MKARGAAGDICRTTYLPSKHYSFHKGDGRKRTHSSDELEVRSSPTTPSYQHPLIAMKQKIDDLFKQHITEEEKGEWIPRSRSPLSDYPVSSDEDEDDGVKRQDEQEGRRLKLREAQRNAKNFVINAIHSNRGRCGQIKSGESFPLLCELPTGCGKTLAIFATAMQVLNEGGKVLILTAALSGIEDLLREFKSDPACQNRISVLSCKHTKPTPEKLDKSTVVIAMNTKEQFDMLKRMARKDVFKAVFHDEAHKGNKVERYCNAFKNAHLCLYTGTPQDLERVLDVKVKLVDPQFHFRVTIGEVLNGPDKASYSQITDFTRMTVKDVEKTSFRSPKFQAVQVNAALLYHASKSSGAIMSFLGQREQLNDERKWKDRMKYIIEQRIMGPLSFARISGIPALCVLHTESLIGGKSNSEHSNKMRDKYKKKIGKHNSKILRAASEEAGNKVYSRYTAMRMLSEEDENEGKAYRYREALNEMEKKFRKAKDHGDLICKNTVEIFELIEKSLHDMQCEPRPRHLDVIYNLLDGIVVGIQFTCRVDSFNYSQETINTVHILGNCLAVEGDWANGNVPIPVLVDFSQKVGRGWRANNGYHIQGSSIPSVERQRTTIIATLPADQQHRRKASSSRLSHQQEASSGATSADDDDPSEDFQPSFKSPSRKKATASDIRNRAGWIIEQYIKDQKLEENENYTQSSYTCEQDLSRVLVKCDKCKRCAGTDAKYGKKFTVCKQCEGDGKDCSRCKYCNRSDRTSNIFDSVEQKVDRVCGKCYPHRKGLCEAQDCDKEAELDVDLFYRCEDHKSSKIMCYYCGSRPAERKKADIGKIRRDRICWYCKLPEGTEQPDIDINAESSLVEIQDSCDENHAESTGRPRRKCRPSGFKHIGQTYRLVRSRCKETHLGEVLYRGELLCEDEEIEEIKFGKKELQYSTKFVSPFPPENTCDINALNKGDIVEALCDVSVTESKVYKWLKGRVESLNKANGEVLVCLSDDRAPYSRLLKDKYVEAVAQRRNLSPWKKSKKELLQSEWYDKLNIKFIRYCGDDNHSLDCHEEDEDFEEDSQEISEEQGEEEDEENKSLPEDDVTGAGYEEENDEETECDSEYEDEDSDDNCNKDTEVDRVTGEEEEEEEEEEEDDDDEEEYSQEDERYDEIVYTDKERKGELHTQILNSVCDPTSGSVSSRIHYRRNHPRVDSPFERSPRPGRASRDESKRNELKRNKLSRRKFTLPYRRNKRRHSFTSDPPCSHPHKIRKKQHEEPRNDLCDQVQEIGIISNGASTLHSMEITSTCIRRHPDGKRRKCVSPTGVKRAYEYLPPEKQREIPQSLWENPAFYSYLKHTSSSTVNDYRKLKAESQWSRRQKSEFYIVKHVEMLLFGISETATTATDYEQEKYSVRELYFGRASGEKCNDVQIRLEHKEYSELKGVQNNAKDEYEDFEDEHLYTSTTDVGNMIKKLFLYFARKEGSNFWYSEKEKCYIKKK